MIDRTIKVKEIMTTEVLTLLGDRPMKEAADIFENNDLHHIPVVSKKNKVKGILSRAEYYQLLHGFTFFKARIAKKFNEEIFNSVTTGEVMTRPVATLYPDNTLEQAMVYFRENLFHSAPVVNRKTKKLEGIITTFDLLNHAYKDETLVS